MDGGLWPHILETWESLPNPPSYTSKFECIIYAHLELEEDKHEIVVVDITKKR